MSESMTTNNAAPTAVATAATPASAAPAPVAPVQNPLTLIMTIKSPADFEQLNQLLTQMQSMPEANPVMAALEKIGTVHFARFVFMENNTKLAVITTFDGQFDTYINEFVNEVGDVFNALLSHMDGAPPLPVQSNRQEFLQYVKDNDLPSLQPFYSAYPTLSVLDIQALAGQN